MVVFVWEAGSENRTLAASPDGILHCVLFFGRVLWKAEMEMSPQAVRAEQMCVLGPTLKGIKRSRGGKGRS